MGYTEWLNVNFHRRVSEDYSDWYIEGENDESTDWTAWRLYDNNDYLMTSFNIVGSLGNVLNYFVGFAKGYENGYKEAAETLANRSGLML